MDENATSAEKVIAILQRRIAEEVLARSIAEALLEDTRDELARLRAS